MKEKEPNKMTRDWFAHFEECPQLPDQFANLKAQLAQIKEDIGGALTIGGKFRTDTIGGQTVLLGFVVRGFPAWMDILTNREIDLLFEIINKLTQAYNAQAQAPKAMAPIMGELKRCGLVNNI